MEKTNRLLSLLPPSADGFLLTSEINQRYISDFAFSDGYVLVTRKKSYIITDFRYAEAAEVFRDNFDIVVPKGSLLLEVIALLSENGVKTLCVEDGSLSHADYLRLSDMLDNVTLVGGTRILDEMRQVKDDDELQKIKEAQRLTDMAFSHILGYITPNATEVDIALELEFFMRKNGADGVAFDTIAVSGKSSSMPHGVPQNKRLENGFLTLDFGAMLGGYCSDMTRTIVIGKADSEMKKLYNTVRSAQKAGIEALCEGISGFECDRVARDIINNAGYAGCFGHGLGHGVGMYIHESPKLSPSADPKILLKKGNVLTVEPGIYLSGKYGCRIEDMLAITADGSLNFTESTKELIEL